MKLGLRQTPRARGTNQPAQKAAATRGPAPPGIGEERYDFSAGRSICIQRHLVGQEENPILVVDGLLANPASVIDFAEAEVKFVPGPAGTYFPGLRGRSSDAYVATFLDELEPAMRDTFCLRDNVRLTVSNMFSLTTIQGSKLRPLQRVPHVDNVGPRGLAVVHFLFDEPLGGTGFFRHRATGWETLSEEEQSDRYNRMVAHQLQEGPLPPGYLYDDSVHFELLFDTKPAMDRLVLFSGHQLHSATIADSVNLPNDVRTGRLTINSFIALS